MDELLTPLQFLNEKVEYGKEISGLPANFIFFTSDGRSRRELIFKYLTGAIKNDQRSLLSKSTIESRVRYQLEAYDLEKDKVLLEANNIVKEYTAMVKADLNNIIKSPESKIDSRSADNIVQYNYFILRRMGIPDDKIRKYLLNNYYDLSDDPEEIRAAVEMRVAWCEKILSLMDQMVLVNYALLGITEKEAKVISQNLASSENRALGVKEIKALIVKNANTFVKGNIIDFTPVGGGKIFLSQNEGLEGLQKFVTLDHLIQMSLLHDAVVIGHGNTKTVLPANLQKIDDQLKADYNTIVGYAEAMEECKRKYSEYSVKNANLEVEWKNIETKFENSKNSVHYDVYSEFRYALDEIKVKKDNLYILTVPFKEMVPIRDRYSKFNMFKLDPRNSSDVKWVYDTLERTYNIQAEQYAGIIAKKAEENKYSSIAKNYNTVIYSYRRNYQYLNSQKVGLPQVWALDIPISTGSAGPLDNMNDVCRQLIKEGYRKIAIVSCNPGHFTLARDVENNKEGADILISNNTLYAESGIVSEDILDAMNITESEVVDEGVKDTLATIGRSVQGVFRNALASVGGLIGKIKESFSEKSYPAPKSTTYKLIDPSSMTIVSTKINSYFDIKNITIVSCEKLRDEMQMFINANSKIVPDSVRENTTEKKFNL